jgi:hypothetical protein
VGAAVKYKAKRPTREQLSGMSPSQLKTFIKRRGHSVARDFFKTESVSHYRGRAYRFRWWAGEFVVDVSCRLTEFDRWANSLDRVVSFKNWIETSAIESKLRSKNGMA